MSSRLRFALVLSLLGIGLAVGYTTGRRFTTHFTDTALPTCPDVLADIIQSAKGNVYEIEDPNYVEPESYDLVTYSVIGNEITSPFYASSLPADVLDEQRDLTSQKEAWRVFTSIIPSENRRMVTEYLVFTDGNDNTLAAVDQTADDLTHWILEVDIADLSNRDALLFTLIHEYAHLLTLNDSQVDIDEDVFHDPANSSLLEDKAAACPYYFTGGGCSHSNSYIHRFYQRFWVSIDPEWKKIDALQYADDLSPYYDGLFNFYLKHQDQFVDDYATTHPAEDIAETFAYFIFSPKPRQESIANEKILFFYEFPELVNLRRQIVNQVCAEFPQ